MGSAGGEGASERLQGRANVEQTRSPVKPSPEGIRGLALACLGASLLVAPAAAAQDDEPAVPDAGEPAQAVYNGTVTDDFPATVALFAEGPTPWVICSGTLIRPDVVLTAAHCIDGDTIGWVHFGTTPYEGGGIDVDAVGQVAHPEFAEAWFDLGDDDGNLNDLALVFLAGAGPVDPVREFTDEPDRLLGDDASLVGYGLSSATGGAGVKREATISLNNVAGDMLVGGSGDGNACSGDSGGSTYVDLPWGQELVGATSFSYAGTCDGTNGVGAVLASVHLGWLHDLAGDPPDRPEGWAWDDSISNSLGSRDDDSLGCAVASGGRGGLALILLLGLRRRR